MANIKEIKWEEEVKEKKMLLKQTIDVNEKEKIGQKIVELMKIWHEHMLPSAKQGQGMSLLNMVLDTMVMRQSHKLLTPLHTKNLTMHVCFIPKFKKQNQSK